MNSLHEDTRPHIVCMADGVKNGPYHVVLNKRVAVGVKTSIQAIDVFFRCFAVFGIKIPTDLLMLTDFLAIVVCKTRTSSTRSAVNKLAAKFKEVEEAEQ